MKHLRKNVFYPPILLIFCTILFSQINNDLFSTSISKLNAWILENFGFLFSWSSFFFLVLLLITYFSPLAQVKIGGKNAKPLLSKSRWFAISTCTTIATGILLGVCRTSFPLCKPTHINNFSYIRCLYGVFYIYHVYALVIYTLCHILCSRVSFCLIFLQFKKKV